MKLGVRSEELGVADEKITLICLLMGDKKLFCNIIFADKIGAKRPFTPDS